MLGEQTVHYRFRSFFAIGFFQGTSDAGGNPT
jgi:hypothetical protein